MKKTIFLIFVTLLLTNLSLAQTEQQTVVSMPTAGDVNIAVVESQYTAQSFKNLGWDYKEYLGYIKMVLDKAGLKFEYLSDSEIEKGNIPAKYKILVLANWRSMSSKQADELKKYTESGGKIFAAYQTSFRNETDQYAQEPRNYLLADIFNANFETWVGSPPKCTFLRRTVAADSPLWKDLPEYIHFYRYTSMVNKHSKPENVLAVWYDEDKVTPSYPQDTNSGLLLGKNCVYIGEDIFAPENAHNPILQKFVKNIIDYLLSN